MSKSVSMRLLSVMSVLTLCYLTTVSSLYTTGQLLQLPTSLIKHCLHLLVFVFGEKHQKQKPIDWHSL